MIEIKERKYKEQRLYERGVEYGKQEMIKDEIEFLEILNADQLCEICKEFTNERLTKLKGELK